MNPIGAVILLVALSMIGFGTRRVALIGVMTGTLFLTLGQSIDIAGFNVFALRFVELTAMARVIARGELSATKLNALDKSVLFLYLFTTVVFLIRSSVDFAYQIGVAVDALLLYLSLRALLRSLEEMQQLLMDLVWLLAPYTLLVVIESFTNQNPFSFMGGVNFGDWMREGRVRCYGSFRHPSLLGTLGATFVPLYIGLWLSGRGRGKAALGFIFSILLVWASNSGGPLNCLFFGVLAWGFWPLRNRMRLVRWGIIVMVVALALVMKAPIWYLPARVSAVTGGTGWHRSYLMDMAAQHFNQWGLAGMNIRDTGAWFPYVLNTTGGADITNQFLSFGITAGIGAMILLIIVLRNAYRVIGSAMHTAQTKGPFPYRRDYAVWALGAMLTAHIGNWLGISYFDQTIAVWFMHLAAISSLSSFSSGAHTVPVETPAELDPIRSPV